MASVAPPAREILTPSALNRLVRDLLADALPQVWVEGELSNVARPASGHMYFTLKDARAQIRCAMFKPASTWLKFRPVDGMQVLARARVGLYEARGEYQLVVEHLEQSGEGALRREFERLKAQLDAEGLFAAARKRELPTMPRRIGVITSATGAAIRDVLSVLGRRFPLVPVDVLPVPVQGKEAPPAIVAMLAKANRAAIHDVLLLTRGGGSLEDLWAFNDEAVARAICASRIPVMSAVGHEVDFSISDFVADARAPTPSAAAELLVPDAAAVGRQLAHHQQRLATLLRLQLEAATQHLDHARARLDVWNPALRLQHGRERLDGLHARLHLLRRNQVLQRHTHLHALLARLRAQHPRLRLAPLQQRSDNGRQRLAMAVRQILAQAQAHVNETGHALRAVSPLATLERGYAILSDTEGRVIRSTQQIGSGMRVDARLADGSVPLRRA